MFRLGRGRGWIECDSGNSPLGEYVVNGQFGGLVTNLYTVRLEAVFPLAHRQ